MLSEISQIEYDHITVNEWVVTHTYDGQMKWEFNSCAIGCGLSRFAILKLGVYSIASQN